MPCFDIENPAASGIIWDEIKNLRHLKRIVDIISLIRRNDLNIQTDRNTDIQRQHTRTDVSEDLLSPTEKATVGNSEV